MVVLIKCGWLHGYLSVPLSHHVWIASCGCLQLIGVLGNVSRPEKVVLLAQTENTKEFGTRRSSAALMGHNHKLRLILGTAARKDGQAGHGNAFWQDVQPLSRASKRGHMISSAGHVSGSCADAEAQLPFIRRHRTPSYGITIKPVPCIVQDSMLWCWPQHAAFNKYNNNQMLCHPQCKTTCHDADLSMAFCPNSVLHIQVILSRLQHITIGCARGSSLTGCRALSSIGAAPGGCVPGS